MPDSTHVKPTPAQAIQKLKDGNRTYADGKAGGKKINDAPVRKKLAKTQCPFAAIVSCSDSRVPVERLFDVGVGDVFVIRNAGNTVVDPSALGSIQYAVAVLGVSVVVVMGHERCGAVAAAVEVVEKNKRFPGAIGRMIEPIIPSVLKVRKPGGEGDLVDDAVRENVRRMVEYLREDPIVSKPSKGKKATLAIAGARFDLDDGTVEFLDELVA